MAIRRKLKFYNGEWPWPFAGDGILITMNGQKFQVAIRQNKWPFVFLAIRLTGPLIIFILIYLFSLRKP